MRKNLSIRQHLKGEKLDIHYYEYISDQISKEVPIIAHSNIEKAKIERVQHVYSDMLNSQKTIFRPLKFESDCCNVNVVFNHNDMTYTCPACHNKVSCHADYMPKGLLTSKKIAKLRHQLHQQFDVVWKNNKLCRNQAYQELAKLLNLRRHEAHIGSVSSFKEASLFYNAIIQLRNCL